MEALHDSEQVTNRKNIQLDSASGSKPDGFMRLSIAACLVMMFLRRGERFVSAGTKPHCLATAYPVGMTQIEYMSILPMEILA